MKTKPYPKMEEKPMVTNEPVVAYHSANQVMNVYQVADVERESICVLKNNFCVESSVQKVKWIKWWRNGSVENCLVQRSTR